MELPQIMTLLTQLEADNPPRTQAALLQYRGGGGCGAWDCKAENGLWYVIKCQNNRQDRTYGLPWKVLTTELICGRLGQLFVPPVCPPVCVVDIPDELASAVIDPNGEHPSAGPSFGSQRVDGAIETKAGGNINLVPPKQAARVVVFQTWLQGHDIAALVSHDGSGTMFLSIDHGYYLTGPQWIESLLTAEPSVSLVLLPQFQGQVKLEDSQLFQGILDELTSLSEIDIIKAFAGIPQEWGASVDFRAKLANFVLKSRNLVEQAVSTLWRGVA